MHLSIPLAGVEFSCVLDMVVSVAGAPWKKEEGSMVKPRCDVRGCSALLEELYSVTPLCISTLYTLDIIKAHIQPAQTN
jgi:hypothetical protein